MTVCVCIGMVSRRPGFGRIAVNVVPRRGLGLPAPVAGRRIQGLTVGILSRLIEPSVAGRICPVTEEKRETFSRQQRMF